MWNREETERNMSPPIRYSKARVRFALRWQVVGVILLSGVVGTATGCSSLNLGGGRLVKELEAENDRLLAEFRAERDRRENVEKALRRTTQRLADSEKQLAQQVSLGSSRLSQLPAGTGLGSSSYGSAGYSNPPPFSSDVSGATSGTNAASGSLSGSGLRWMRRRP